MVFQISVRVAIKVTPTPKSLSTRKPSFDPEFSETGIRQGIPSGNDGVNRKTHKIPCFH